MTFAISTFSNLRSVASSDYVLPIFFFFFDPSPFIFSSQLPKPKSENTNTILSFNCHLDYYLQFLSIYFYILFNSLSSENEMNGGIKKKSISQSDDDSIAFYYYFSFRAEVATIRTRFAFMQSKYADDVKMDH